MKTKTPLLAWVFDAPGWAFTAFMALHLVMWTALPTLLYLNLPLDLLEALIYGREWQLGYDKLPPLPWWLVEIVYRLVGYDFAYYLLAQITIVATFWLIFVTARPLVGVHGALVCVLFLDGLHYFNSTSVKFNHDVIQLPFWALAGLTFHRALRKNHTLDWALLGFALGAAFWAKYFVVVLAAPMALFLIFDPNARKNLASRGPYITLAVALIVIAPHLIWLVRNDFLPLAYAEHRAALPNGWYDHLWHPLRFAISQWFFLIPSFLITAPLFLPRSRALSTPAITGWADQYDKRVVTCLAFGPIVTVLAGATISGRGAIALWGYPLFLFLGLWVLLWTRAAPTVQQLARITMAWGAVSACFMLAFAINNSILERFDHRYRAVFYPGSDLAREISDRYRKATGKTLYYVIANIWDGGNIMHYTPHKTRVLIDGDPERAPWIDLADLHRQGAVVVWTWGERQAMPKQLAKITAFAVIQPPFNLPYRRGSIVLGVGWAILPPNAPSTSPPIAQP